MSYHLVEAPVRRRPHRGLLAALGVALLALALVAGYSATRPVTVIVDGTPCSVTAGTTTSELRTEGLLASSDGCLLSVKGDVLRKTGGGSVTMTRNGDPVLSDQRVFDGDVIVSRPGVDATESVETTIVSVPFRTVYQGEGSLSKVATEGVSGRDRVVQGSVSGIEVSRAVVREPVDAVVTLYRPAPGAKMVALTFDDGPWPGNTERILKVLEENDVRATFFMVGVRVKRAPKLAAQVADAGHLVANHSFSHQSFATASKKELKRQIEKGRSTIKHATGVDTRWVRPPYGAMDKAAWKYAKKHDYRIVRWTVDSEDWRKPGAKKIASRVLKRVKPGSVILMHDGGGDRDQTVEALPVIIKKLKAEGYVFVTLEDLYRVDATD